MRALPGVEHNWGNSTKKPAIPHLCWYDICITICMRTPTAVAKTVLIADDDLWMRDMLTLLLSEEGLLPIEASTGPETVKAAREQHPDVILLDIGLPGKSGLHVLEDLRKRSSTSRIPVMLLSGQINLVESGHAHDAEAAFHKPLDFTAFLNKVRELTRSAAQS